MDTDLTKFFSKLFLPSGKKTYPYYPYQCRYRTVCQSVIGLEPPARARAVPLLQRSLDFLQPEIERIQEEIKGAPFSEQLAIFRELKARIPPAWYEPWADVRVELYLNESEMREFRIEG